MLALGEASCHVKSSTNLRLPYCKDVQEAVERVMWREEREGGERERKKERREVEGQGGRKEREIDLVWPIHSCCSHLS